MKLHAIHQFAKSLLLPLLLGCLTLGLAPFVPEPHLAGKLRWIAGGGHGMQQMDYLDLLMHGAPWAALIVTAGVYVATRRKRSQG